jgi:hypothetical protein
MNIDTTDDHAATIGALADAQSLLAGTAGTTITPRTQPHRVPTWESAAVEGPIALTLKD